MKLKQQTLGFTPIKIKLETVEEANALREIVDNIEKKDISEEAYSLSVKLSNAFFNCALEVPLNAQEKEEALHKEENEF